LAFAFYFGTTAKFWLGLQDDYDIEEEQSSKKDILTKIKTKAPIQTI
jgi:plasmid maintenance system antidote protein VapI